MFALLLIWMYGARLFGFLMIFYIDNCNLLCEIICYLLSLINRFTLIIFFRAMNRLILDMFREVNKNVSFCLFFFFNPSYSRYVVSLAMICWILVYLKSHDGVSNLVADCFISIIKCSFEDILMWVTFLQVTSPAGNVVHSLKETSGDKFEFKAPRSGMYKFCFHNPYSTPETVSFYIHVGHIPNENDHAKDGN